MNILLCSDTFLPKIGGTENVVSALAKKYVELGHNVMVVCGDCGELKQAMPFQVVKVPTLYMKPIDDYYCFPRLKKNLKKIIAEFQPDVIHIHTIFVLANYLLNYAKKHNIKVVVTIHTKCHYNYDLHIPFKSTNIIHKITVKALTKRPKEACERADVSTTVSENSKCEELIGAYNLPERKIRVIRNGYDNKKYRLLKSCEISSYLWREEKGIILCYAGRLSIKEKNLLFILKVLQGLRDSKVPFVFYFAGDGGDRKKLMKFCTRYNLNNCVFFLRWLTQDELCKLYNCCDAMLFPSEFDTDGLVVKDAIKCGCLCYVIESSGPSENIIDGVNGYCLPLETSSFVKKLKNLYISKFNDYDSYLINRKSIANTQFKTWTDIANEYLNLYKNLLNMGNEADD